MTENAPEPESSAPVAPPPAAPQPQAAQRPVAAVANAPAADRKGAAPKAPAQPGPAQKGIAIESFYSADELVRHLERLRFDATSLLGAPAPSSVVPPRGFIEVIFRIGPGFYMIGGWTKGEPPSTTRATVLASGRFIPASVCCARYNRPDLPPGAVAFCGLLRAETELAEPDDQFVLTLGDPTWLLPSRKPLKVLLQGQAMAWLNNVAKIDPAIRTLITESFKIVPKKPLAPETHGCHVGIDRLIVYPGFGALVRGWLLAPVGGLVHVAVRQGRYYAEAKQETIAIKPRLDLIGNFPQLADRVDRAGFSAICTGDLVEIESDRPALSLTLSDGSRMEVPVPVQSIRIGYSAKAIEDLILDFPAYRLESYHAALCTGYLGTRRARSTELHYLRRFTGARALLFGMPLAACDVRLALHELRAGIREWDGTAICIHIGPQHDRAAVMRTVNEVMGDMDIGIVQYGDGGGMARAVARILKDAGVRRFTLVQEATRLLRGGWDAARAYLTTESDDRSGPELYLIGDSELGRLDPVRKVGALSWTAAAFAAWADSAVPLIGTDVIGADLIDTAEATQLSGLARSYHASRVSKPLDRFNAQLVQAVG